MVVACAALVAHTDRHIFQNDKAALVLERFSFHVLFSDRAVTVFAFVSVHLFNFDYVASKAVMIRKMPVSLKRPTTTAALDWSALSSLLVYRAPSAM